MRQCINVLGVGAVFLASFAAQCPRAMTPTATDSVVSVSVSPSSLTLQTGQSATLSGTVNVQGNAARTVTWSTSSPAVATVDANGVVTAVGPGVATIVARSTADPTIAGATAVTVTAAAPITVSGLFNIIASKMVDTGCNFGNSFTGQFQVSGNADGSSATFRMIERLTRAYSGTVQSSGAFSGSGSGDLDGFLYSGTITGQGTATTIFGTETLNFSSGCPGKQVVYGFTGTR